MNKYLSEIICKDCITREELHNRIIEDRLSHEKRINGNSLQLEETIAMILNRYKRPVTVKQLLYYLIRDGYEDYKPTRWSVKDGLERLIRAGLVILPDDCKGAEYWLQYEIIDNSIHQHFYLNEEISHIESLLKCIWWARKEHQRLQDSDFITIIILKFTKVKDSLMNIKRNISNLPEIDKAISQINRLVCLYRHPHSARDFKTKENTKFNEFDRQMKILNLKLKEIVRELGGQ